MEELLKQIEFARTKDEKQALSAKIISASPQFLSELGDLEQKYQIGLRKCVEVERTKTAAELVMQETDIYKDFKYKKRLNDMVIMALKVLDMYTGS